MNDMSEQSLFKTSVAWKVLDYFFRNPSIAEYVNAISRNLGISSGSASTSCKTLCNKGLLTKKEIGNGLFYSLNNENAVVKRLKSAWFMDRLMKFKGVWANGEFVSVALYGSYASGEFTEKSDCDFLVITNVSPKSASQTFKPIEEKLGLEVSITAMPLAEWVALAKKRDRFHLEVVSNHILLWGSSIVI